MTRNKFVALLSIASLIVSLTTPIVASAATTVSVIGVQAVNTSVSNTDYKDLGEIKLEVPVSDLNPNDSFLLRLPSDFNLNIPTAVNTTTDLSRATITKPDGSVEPLIQVIGSQDPWNDGIANHLAVYQTNPNELKVVVTNAAKAPSAGSESNTTFKINLGSVYVPGNTTNTIQAVIEAKPGIAFGNESIPIATVGNGTVSVSIDSSKTITENGDGTLDTIRFKEDSPGSMKAGNDSIKLKLPAGFEWTDSSYAVNFEYGDSQAVGHITATRSVDTSEIDLQVPAATNAASYFTIRNAAIRVNDSTLAKYGELNLGVSGSSKTNITSLVIGNYMAFGATAVAQNPTDVIAGRAGVGDADQTKTGQIIIEENAPGSLRMGGTIRIQLTGGAKWAVDQKGQLAQPPQINTTLSDLQGLEFDETVGNHGWELVGNSGDTIMATVKAISNGMHGGKFVFDNGLLDLPADTQATDIHAVVSGNAGVTGDAGVIAKVIPPVSIGITDSTPNHIQAGVQDRTISNVVVKENTAGAINAPKGSTPFVRFTFQPGVKPNNPDPSQIKVDGDLVLDTTSINTNTDSQGRWYIEIPVRSTSGTPSTITLMNEKVTVDRSVPEGNIVVELAGSMVQTAGLVTNDFPSSNSVASVAAASVVVASNGNVANAAKFTIGSLGYTVNEQTKLMDVAPFIDENGRTQLPVRAVSGALGAMVGWDPQDGTVTILKDGKAVSITVGSYVMNVGGVFVQNDSAPLIKDGRVFLPLRIIAEALGAEVTWNAETQTVYLN
ncbi:MAG TPA: copper amine oxidase N-terminal domain-containing protein [Bacillota bacterium]|nr:copper amine oxidase N-terminal domain-containing protein [Bacillota bacterium]